MATFSNGKSNGAILPSKRKASEQLGKSNSKEEGMKEGTTNNILSVRQEIKHVVKDYVDLKLLVQDSVVGKHHKLTSIAGDSPYPDVAGIPNAYNIFNLHQGGIPKLKRERAIAAAKSYHALQQSNFLGYQVNLSLDYQHDFGSYLDSHVST